MTRILSLLLFIFLALPPSALATPPTLTGKVLWVYDGDTIKVEHIGKIRLIGIDTPETESSERDNHYLRQGISREHLRRVAKKALHFVIRNAKGKNVTIHHDKELHDRHGRTLAYVYLPDGELLNRKLIDEGLAAVYRKFNFHKKKDFLAAEKSARNKGVGLWGEVQK